MIRLCDWPFEVIIKFCDVLHSQQQYTFRFFRKTPRNLVNVSVFTKLSLLPFIKQPQSITKTVIKHGQKL